MTADSSERLYVQNFDGWKAALSKKRFSDKELEVKVIERGIVLPALMGYSRKKITAADSQLFFLPTLLKEKNLFSTTRM